MKDQPGLTQIKYSCINSPARIPHEWAGKGDIQMRMELSEFADFAKLSVLFDLVPRGAKVEIYFHPSQGRGPIPEGPWYSCRLICDGFASQSDAESFWDAVAERVKIGLNGLKPYNKSSRGNYWRMEIPLERFDIARMNTIKKQAA